MSTGFEELRSQVKEINSMQLLPHDRGFSLAVGPCAIEDEDSLFKCAEAASRVGACYLRGGAVKLRTRNKSYHGPGAVGWRLLRDAADQYDLLTISEVASEEHVYDAAEYIDVLQIGARSMWNFNLLRACAESGGDVLLKRGIGASTRDWLGAVERLLDYGAERVILCERGISSTDSCSRNAVDVSALVFLLEELSLPLWLDVSHSSGDPKVAIRLLALARKIGLDGAMGEIHPNPSDARCDGAQAIPVSQLVEIL